MRGWKPPRRVVIIAPPIKKEFDLKGRLRDQAVSRILQVVVASQVISQPHMALMVEGLRQAYSHREFIYDIAREISSDRSVEEKLQTIEEKAFQQMRSEAASCLIGGGVRSVSLFLAQQGFFTKPFGSKGPVLDEQQSGIFRSIFENSLSQMFESRVKQ